MYLNRNRSGYGWYSLVKSKDMGGNEMSHYMNFSFKKDCEPMDMELNDRGSYEGELYFIDKRGIKRKVFPIVKEYNGLKYFEFKLLSEETSNNASADSTSTDVKVESDELPFY